MNAQMVVEVVPLPEVHGAVRVVALKNFEVALSLWVLELKNPEHLGRWNVWIGLLLVNLQFLIQANFTAEDNFNLVTLGRNLIENALVFNLVPCQHDALLVGVVNQWTILTKTLGFVLTSITGRSHIL